MFSSASTSSQRKLRPRPARQANQRRIPLGHAEARPGPGPDASRGAGGRSGRLRRLARFGLRLGAVTGAAWLAVLGVQRAFVFATTSARFEVAQLAFAPTAHLSDARLRELLALDRGTNILSLDLDALAEKVAADPWVEGAKVVRELPDTLRVEVVEHRPAAAVLAGYLYLVDDRGRPFKRVERGERGQLPVITGVARETLIEDSERARREISRALEILRVYGRKQRPRLGEIHLDADGAVTLYAAETGGQYRLGRGDPGPKLARLDALRAALGERADALAVVHLDASARGGGPDRVFASFFEQNEVPPELSSEQHLHDADARASAAGDSHASARPPVRRRAARLPRAQ